MRLERSLALLPAALLLLPCALPLAACGGGGGPDGAIVRDRDHDGILDDVDNDMDGDGRLNQFDDDVDGDGVPNIFDLDADEDSIPNEQDETPLGPWLPAPQTLFVSIGVASVSFGDVPQGQLAGPATVSVQNDTINPATVRRVELVGTGGGVYTLDTAGLPGRPFQLAPGASVQMHATFRPRAGTPALGRIEVELGIGSGVVTGVVHLLGQGTAPAITTSGNPSTINFGDVPVGVTAGPGIARIQNDSGQGYVVSAIDLTGTGGGTFSLDLAPLGAALPLNLAAGQTVEFHVRYAPLQGVPNVGEVRVQLDGPGGTSTGTLDLLGQGLAPAMTLRPAQIDFGTRLAGVERSEIAVEVRNEFYANGTLNVTSVTLTDDAGGDVSIVANPAPFTIAPGGAPVLVRLRFAPLAGHLGGRVARLRVQGNDPLFPIDRTETLTGRGAGWQASATPLPADLTAPPPPLAGEVAWLAGSTRFVARSAGPDGTYAALLNNDDELVVVDADPDGDAATADARVVVRWSGLRLNPQPSGAPVDAGTGRHVIFTGPGVDGTLGTGDDQVHVLDTVSGALRSLACPNLGAAKSLPVRVNPSTGLIVVGAGVGGGLLPGADSLLVYNNLVGNLSAIAPDATVGLGVAVPDLAACAPVVMGSSTVVQPAADASDSPDLSDRQLSDGNEGLVQVRGLGVAAVVEVLDLARALAEPGAEQDGELFCRPLALDASTLLVATEGPDASSQTDDELVRVDDVGSSSWGVGATRSATSLVGLASRPVDLGGGFAAWADAGADATWGTADDSLHRLAWAGAMSANLFGPVAALGGSGGAATRPMAHAGTVLVPSWGADGLVGGADDRVLVLDPTIAGPASILGVLPVPGGLFAGDRTTERSLAGPTLLDARFVAVLDRGADALEGTADDVLRVYRDKDRDGRFGTLADDLDGDGVLGATDAVRIPLPGASAARTPLAATASGHLLVVGPGADGALGTGKDDLPVVWWLREAVTLP